MLKVQQIASGKAVMVQPFRIHLGYGLRQTLLNKKNLKKRLDILPSVSALGEYIKIWTLHENKRFLFCEENHL